LLSRIPAEPFLEALEPQLYAALPELAEAAGATRGAEAEGFLLERLHEAFSHGLFDAIRRPHRPLSEEAFGVLCDSLGAIGTQAALPVLRDLGKRVRETGQQRLARAIQRIEARTR
jgi:hypothetical protein